MYRLGDNINSIAHNMVNSGRGIETGFSRLDSSLLLQIAWNIDVPAVIVSLEMSKQLIGERLISQVSGLGMHRLKSKKITDREKGVARAALEKISRRKIYVMDEVRLDKEFFLEKFGEEFGEEFGDVRPVLFIDYLQLLHLDFRMSGEREVSLISSRLKRLAIDLNIPIVAASQLNREVEKRESRVPCLSDLRGSGTLEQDADVVMLLHRPGYYSIEEDEDDDEAYLYVAKNRSGPVGKVELKWNRETMSFREVSHGYRDFGE